MMTFDFISMIILLIGYNLIEYLLNDFALSFDSQTVELRDFALVVNKIPDKYNKISSKTNL